MSLRDVMLKDLERGLAIVRDGHEIVPAWRILTPDGDFVILTRFDPDKPDGRVVEPLVAALRDPRLATVERAQIATLLGRTGAPRAAPLLVELTRAQDLGLRRAGPGDVEAGSAMLAPRRFPDRRGVHRTGRATVRAGKWDVHQAGSVGSAMAIGSRTNGRLFLPMKNADPRSPRR